MDGNPISINNPNYTNDLQNANQDAVPLQSMVIENIGLLPISEFNRAEGDEETIVIFQEMNDEPLSREEAKKQYWPFVE
jgi:hypothetical protein